MCFLTSALKLYRFLYYCLLFPVDQCHHFSVMYDHNYNYYVWMLASYFTLQITFIYFTRNKNSVINHCKAIILPWRRICSCRYSFDKLTHMHAHTHTRMCTHTCTLAHTCMLAHTHTHTQ